MVPDRARYNGVASRLDRWEASAEIQEGMNLAANARNTKPSKSITASAFINKMKEHQSDDELKKIQQYFKMQKGQYGEGDKFMGIRMGTLFKLAKESTDMAPSEIEKLLESNIHEVRAGAVSIMNNLARNK